MKPGAVLVDVAIDQGGCFETSHPTTHADPTYVVDGVIHYCVANMPGAAPLTSTYALGAATAPYLLALANKGVEQAFADGFDVVFDGRLRRDAVGQFFGGGQIFDCFDSQIRIDSASAIANEQAMVHHFARFAGFDDQGDAGACSFAHEVVVDCC